MKTKNVMHSDEQSPVARCHDVDLALSRRLVMVAESGEKQQLQVNFCTRHTRTNSNTYKSEDNTKSQRYVFVKLKSVWLAQLLSWRVRIVMQRTEVRLLVQTILSFFYLYRLLLSLTTSLTLKTLYIANVSNWMSSDFLSLDPSKLSFLSLV